nr:hypothetical protein [Accumulibacter sp.]
MRIVFLHSVDKVYCAQIKLEPTLLTFGDQKTDLSGARQVRWRQVVNDAPPPGRHEVRCGQRRGTMIERPACASAASPLAHSGACGEA